MSSPITASHGYAEATRERIRSEAAEMGIDESFLSDLVEQFYTRVRADARLGPIFAAEIDDWGPHLARMKTFWASVALSAGTYAGKPVPVHQKLSGVRREDFAIWLGLFRDTLDDIAPTSDAADYLMDRANRIARSLQMAMFDRIAATADTPRFG